MPQSPLTTSLAVGTNFTMVASSGAPVDFLVQPPGAAELCQTVDGVVSGDPPDELAWTFDLTAIMAEMPADSARACTFHALVFFAVEGSVAAGSMWCTCTLIKVAGAANDVVHRSGVSGVADPETLRVHTMGDESATAGESGVDANWDMAIDSGNLVVTYSGSPFSGRATLCPGPFLETPPAP
jgi:hypothetical protein